MVQTVHNFWTLAGNISPQSLLYEFFRIIGIFLWKYYALFLRHGEWKLYQTVKLEKRCVCMHLLNIFWGTFVLLIFLLSGVQCFDTVFINYLRCKNFLLITTFWNMCLILFIFSISRKNSRRTFFGCTRAYVCICT